MNLLFDLGNTALKWAYLSDPESPHTLVHSGAHHVSEKMVSMLEGMSCGEVFGCSVASRDLRLSLTRAVQAKGFSLHWLHAQDRYEGHFSLINRYTTPSQLGADRWYAALGATSFLPNQALLVVHVGTATTVDSVYPIDDNVMVFAAGTATLPKADGDYREMPTDTMTAIVTGIIDCQLGLIERGMRTLQKMGFEPRLVLAGGAAARFAPYLMKEFPESILKHNLVLRGLALIAHQEEGNKS